MARSSSFPETAVVTGGASGIGRAIVELLEREGAQVDVLDLQDGFDVADAAAWESVGPVDLACLNAGVTTGTTDVAQVSDEAYRRILRTNVDGVVFGVRRLAQLMAPGSAIVATASLAGLVPTERDPLYALTKHALVGFIRSVAPRLEQAGIRINAVAPGYADTPLLDGDARAAMEAAGFPLLRPGEVAEAVVLAARDETSGQVWVCQPGREPVRFRFPGVPGPRVPGREGVRPPL
jgi:NAD(P)-dependent dehydrogenase (short-subunit alcohol dehydrogenase family)